MNALEKARKIYKGHHETEADETNAAHEYIIHLERSELELKYLLGTAIQRLKQLGDKVFWL